MKTISLCLIFFTGMATGALLYRFSQRTPQGAAIFEEPKPKSMSWDDLGDGKKTLPKTISIEGQMWQKGSALFESSQSNMAWLRGLKPWTIELPHLKIDDEQFLQESRFFPIFDGAHCVVSAEVQSGSPGNQISLSRVLNIEFVRGVDTTIDECRRDAARYHEVVVYVQGNLGRISGRLYAFDSEESRLANLIDHAILVESTVSDLGYDDWFRLSRPEAVGTKVQLDAMFSRPWKDDQIAPCGRFVFIHRISEVNE